MDLRDAAGLLSTSAGPEELTLRKTSGRLLHVDDPNRLDGGAAMAGHNVPPDVGTLHTLPEVPLTVHARYTRLEMRAAAGSEDRMKVRHTERATGLEPATSSLGSWHSTN